MANENKKANGWNVDYGYEGCLVKREGSHAVVVYKDLAIEGIRWGIQVFDEADERAMAFGRYEYNLFGVWSESAAIAIGEAYISDNLK